MSSFGRFLRGAISRAPGVSSRVMSTSTNPGFFELRQYDIKPEHMKTYMDETAKSAPVRSALFNQAGVRWLGFWTTEIGGNLNRIHHLYHYKDYDTRDAVRAAAAASGDWAAYLNKAKPCFEAQTSAVFVEALPTLTASNLPGALAFKHPTTVNPAKKVAYEMRVYQLQLGYSRVPDFLKLYGEGLPDKLAVDKTGLSTLVTLLFSDSGPMNKVIELWRHESMQGGIESRVASREAHKWKAAVAGIAKEAISFETLTLRPASFSEWK